MLGPLLFLLFINDIPKFPKTNIALFADDLAIYSHSFSAIPAAKQIQIHLGLLSKFYSYWKIQINEAKTENIIFSRKFKESKIFQNIKVNNVQTITKESVKYLGIILDKRLTFKKNTDNSVINAYNVLRTMYYLIKRNSKLNLKNKKLIYLTMARPILTHGAPIWCSMAVTHLNKLQRMQNKFLRLINNADYNCNVLLLHQKLKIPSVTDYIDKLISNFYNNQTNNNPYMLALKADIKLNANSVFKHKLSYCRFLENAKKL